MRTAADLKINRSVIRRCCGSNHRQRVADRVQIGEREFVLQNHLAAIPIQRGISQVRTDPLDA